MSRALLLLLACLVGCAANHPGPPPSPAAESVDPFPTEEGRLALFEELVTDIRDFHVFAPNAFENLGRSWEDDLPDLEQEFRGAEDDAALALALRAPRHDLSRPGTSLTEQTGHIVYTSSSRLVDRVVGSEP